MFPSTPARTPFRFGTGMLSAQSLAWSEGSDFDLVPLAEEAVQPSIKYQSAHQPEDPLVTMIALVGAPEEMKFAVEKKMQRCTTAHLYTHRRNHPLFLGALLIQVLNRHAEIAEAVLQKHPTYRTVEDLVADAVGIHASVLTGPVMNGATEPAVDYEHELWLCCQEWVYGLPDEVAGQVPLLCHLLGKFNLDLLPHSVSLVLRRIMEDKKGNTTLELRNLEYAYNMAPNTLKGVHEVVVALVGPVQL